MRVITQQRLRNDEARLMGGAENVKTLPGRSL